MSAVVESAVSTRSSSGEYVSNPLSPPSFGLDPPNMSSPRSDDSRDSSRFTRDRLNSAASVGDIEFSPSPKPPKGVPNGGSASTSAEQRGTSPSQKESRKRAGSIANIASTGDKRAATKICRVCGDKAYSYNFNVITCESCKAFFRRNANKEKEIRCPFNDQCDINIVSRRFCQRCRLQKCFTVGMKKEWIMSEEARIEKKQRVQENRERRLAEANSLINQQKKVAKHVEGEDASSKACVLQLKDEPVSLGTRDSSLNAPSSNTALYSSALPSLSGGTTPGSLPGGGTFRDVAAPGSIESLPSPMITSAGFRPPLLTESMPSSANTLITQSNASVMQSQSAFISPHQQQDFVSQVAQQVHFAQAQMHQAAQLEQQLQQQATAHHIVQHQAAQLAAAQAQQQQQRFAAAAAVVAAAVPAAVPSIPSTPAAARIAPLAPLSIITQNVPPPAIPQNVHMVSDAPLTSASSDADMVTIPKDVLLKLVEQNNQKSVANSSSLPPSHSRVGIPQKCVCVCLCGRYQPDRLIVDEMTTTSAQCLSMTSCPTCPGLLSSLVHDEVMEPSETKSQCRSLFKNTCLLEEEMNSVKIDPDCYLMTPADQDRLNELVIANGVWAELDPNSIDAARHEHGCPSKVDMVNMADGAIRRMIKMVKRVDSFRRLEHHDQIQLLKNSCMEYIILRGAMSYDPEQNVWKGPTIKSGYNVKLDAMKDTRDNMFESSIRSGNVPLF
ncbi:unnamed protein product [Toxocara canis]|uniref:Nuclear receptor domain-containing protein n=1 Tax=Toxocara canis TaxID=6265 RepID=A0A183UWN0_TOXCA|nr:unnamed protein product [Toxocara canis]